MSNDDRWKHYVWKIVRNEDGEFVAGSFDDENLETQDEADSNAEQPSGGRGKRPSEGISEPPL